MPAYYGKTRFNNKYFFREDPKRVNGHLFNVSPRMDDAHVKRHLKIKESLNFISKIDGKEDAFLQQQNQLNPQSDGED